MQRLRQNAASYGASQENILGPLLCGYVSLISFFLLFCLFQFFMTHTDSLFPFFLFSLSFPFALSFIVNHEQLWAYTHCLAPARAVQLQFEYHHQFAE